MNDLPDQISTETLKRLIKREFGEQAAIVTNKFKGINSDSEFGRRRISAAILKLANKDINQIDNLIERANIDFRDVLAPAEYPRAFEAGFEELTEEEEQRIDDEDWNEYQNWLIGKEA